MDVSWVGGKRTDLTPLKNRGRLASTTIDAEKLLKEGAVHVLRVVLHLYMI